MDHDERKLGELTQVQLWIVQHQTYDPQTRTYRVCGPDGVWYSGATTQDLIDALWQVEHARRVRELTRMLRGLPP